MPPSHSPLVRVCTLFGYDLDETALLADPRVATTDIQSARLCAVLIEHVTGITDAHLRYTISQDPDDLDGIVADTVTAIGRAWRAIAMLLATAVGVGAARQLTPTGSRDADGEPWRPAVVRISGTHGGPYPCQIGPPRWNGWDRPRFTRDVVARLMADLDAQWRRDGSLPDFLPGQLLASGDVLLLHDAGVREFVGPDDDDLFAVGAGTWNWEEWPD
ncbi:hypothetical protein O3597_25775 [Verrucosispora sp. WMMA2044]|uniref:hypothetical protein n=1 Tax=Verrucosispora sp. WMMA2044 TaxID=3016419 RepID=UPI00248BC4D0|nr:hypothetical protein [Verrucosispora sp. WMMA2044]WBB48451.1 hypothetical protein O3597_25775 [Verrucosispora sp. WMMA2044]